MTGPLSAPPAHVAGNVTGSATNRPQRRL